MRGARRDSASSAITLGTKILVHFFIIQYSWAGFYSLSSGYENSLLSLSSSFSTWVYSCTFGEVNAVF